MLKNVFKYAALACLIISQPNIAYSKNLSKEAVRQLVFTDQFSIGKVYAYKATGEHMQGTGRFLGEAKGVLTIPRDVRIYLIPSYEVLEKPEALRTVAPDSFYAISFGRTSLLANVVKVIPFLKHLTGLQQLQVVGAELKDDHLTSLKSLINLESIGLGCNEIEGRCFKELKPLSRLSKLDLTFNPLTPVAFTYISQFKNLEVLRLSRCGVTDSAIKELTKLPKLRLLTLNRANITAKGLANLKDMKSLRVLNLTDTNLSVQDLLVLKGLQLHSLDLPGTKYSTSELDLLKATFPKTSLIQAGKILTESQKVIFAPLH